METKKKPEIFQICMEKIFFVYTDHGIWLALLDWLVLSAEAGQSVRPQNIRVKASTMVISDLESTALVKASVMEAERGSIRTTFFKGIHGRSSGE